MRPERRNLAVIVEGQGEIRAVPTLIRRISGTLFPELPIHIPTLRVRRNQLIKSGVLEEKIELVAQRLRPEAILVLLDSDDDCPAELGPELLARARGARPDIPLAVVLAHREFESWFVAAAESLRGRHGLPPDLEAPPDPESIRGAKEWLSKHLPRPYTATRYQEKFSAIFDTKLAQRAGSFKKFHREIVRLLGEMARRSA